jgi:filamentous hemagglutinin
MNKLFHRVVFNRHRGQLVVASEADTATRGGQSSSGLRRAARRAHTSGLRAGLNALVASMAAVVWHPVAAQVIADPGAPVSQRPTVLSDQSGRPLVNIQTPTAAGVSRNTYRQFDVQSNGVVLNNSRHSNPWLATGEARVILNEVNSSHPSHLRGAITVNGAAAQVIVANPSGIQVDGASFVNASRATLTTGSAQMNGAELTGFRVQQGSVHIGAGGLDVRGVGYTDILSRAVSIAGAINAGDQGALAVVTGAQTVDYASGAIGSPMAGTGDVPALAIDASALGSMYAGSITLLATEAGVGVRHAGTSRAGRQLVITAEGRLENSGQLSARVVSLGTVSGNVDNTGSIQADAVLSVAAGGDLNLSGSGAVQTSAEGPSVVLRATRDVALQPGAQVGSSATGGQLTLSAGRDIRLTQNSALNADAAVQLAADGQLLATDAQAGSAHGELSLLAAQGIQLADSHLRGQQLHLETGTPFEQTAADVGVLRGSLRSQDTMTVIASGTLRIETSEPDALRAGSDMHLQAAANLDLMPGVQAHAGRDLSAAAGGQLGLWGAPAGQYQTRVVGLEAVGDMQLSSGRAWLAGSQLVAGGNLSLRTHQGDAALYAQPDSWGEHHTRVALRARGDIDVTAYAGSVWAQGLEVGGRNVGILSNGTTSLGYSTNVTPFGHYRVGSLLVATGDLTVGSVHDSATVQVDAGTLLANGDIRLVGQGDVLLYASEDHEQTAQGGWQARAVRTTLRGGNVDVQGGSIFTQAADLDAWNGNVSLRSTKGALSLGARSGMRTEIEAGGHVALHAEQTLDLWYADARTGQSMAATSAQGDIRNTGSVLVAGDVLGINAKGSQQHTDAFIDGGALSVRAEQGAIDLRNSRLQTRQTQTDGLQTVSGQLSVESGAGMSADAATLFSATTDLSIIAGQGDVTLTPWGLGSGATGLVLSQSQIGMGRGLTLAARDGRLSLTGQPGVQGFDSSRRVDLNLSGDIRLVGTEVDLRGSKLRTAGRVDVVATEGNLDIQATRATASEYGFTNTYWDRVEIAASQGFDLRALGNINANGLATHTWGHGQMLAGGDLTVSGVYNDWRYQQGSSLWQQHYLTPSELRAEQGITLGAMGGHLTLNGTSVAGGAGTVRLHALGDVVLEAAPEHALYQSTNSQVKRTWYGHKRTTTTSTHNESLVASPVWIDGQNIEIKAGNNVRTYASQLSARGDLAIEAGDDADYFAVRDLTHNHTSVSISRSLWGIGYSDSTLSNSQQLSGVQPTLLQSSGSITSLSGGDQTLQGTEVSYGGTATFTVGVGDKARADARLILEGVVDSVSHSRTFESDAVLWMKQASEGSVQETLRLPSFTGPSAPVFNGPVLADIPAGEFTTQIASLSQQPGLAYLNQLGQRSDVNWRPVQLAYDQWQYEQEGLTGAGAALVAVAVAWVTGGTGASLVGASSTSTAGMMANAAFTALASQAAITFINNKGDVGKTLRDLGRSDVVKATVAAALTAGLLSQLGTIQEISALNGANAGLSDKLTFNLINAGGRALTTTVIEGGDLEDALRGALLGGLVDTLHGGVAGKIKGLEASYLAHKLAHALAGCVAGAAVGGECRDGAIGAAVGEVVAGLFQPENSMFHTQAERDKVLAYSKLVAGGISAYAGGNAQTAITTAETAVLNNALFIPPLVKLLALVAAGYTTGVGDGNPVLGLQTIGQGQDPLSQALVNGAQAAVNLSMQQYPRETQATLQVMAAAGQAVDASISYVDDATGNVVSANWNSLSPETRNTLIGAGKVTGVVLSPVGVGQVRGLIANTPKIPAAKVLQAQHQADTARHYIANNFNRDGADPTLMQQMLQTAADAATHNANAREVVLGRHVPGSATSYEKVAAARGATYFELDPAAWNNTANILGNDGMWEINKTFLDNQIQQGKSFVFVSNPGGFPVRSAARKEYDYLVSQGFTIVPQGGMFHAIKN